MLSTSLSVSISHFRLIGSARRRRRFPTHAHNDGVYYKVVRVAARERPVFWSSFYHLPCCLVGASLCRPNNISRSGKRQTLLGLDPCLVLKVLLRQFSEAPRQQQQ